VWIAIVCQRSPRTVSVKLIDSWALDSLSRSVGERTGASLALGTKRAS
jgi:hypothetical protein